MLNKCQKYNNRTQYRLCVTGIWVCLASALTPITQATLLSKSTNSLILNNSFAYSSDVFMQFLPGGESLPVGRVRLMLCEGRWGLENGRWVGGEEGALERKSHCEIYFKKHILYLFRAQYLLNAYAGKYLMVHLNFVQCAHRSSFLTVALESPN